MEMTQWTWIAYLGAAYIVGFATASQAKKAGRIGLLVIAVALFLYAISQTTS